MRWTSGILFAALLAGCSVNTDDSAARNSAEYAMPTTSSHPTTDPVLPSQSVPLGTRIEVRVETGMTDGNTTVGTPAFTVSNLRPITPAISLPDTEVAGTYYAVDATVESLSGTIIVHPFNFSLRTADGTDLDPELSAVKNGLPATDLPQGQKVSGQIAAQVPPGQIGGTQLGRWTTT